MEPTEPDKLEQLPSLWNFQTTRTDAGGQPPPRISERHSCCPIGYPSPTPSRLEGMSLVQSLLRRAQVGDPENPKEGPSLGRGCIRDTPWGLCPPHKDPKKTPRKTGASIRGETPPNHTSGDLPLQSSPTLRTESTKNKEVGGGTPSCELASAK